MPLKDPFRRGATLLAVVLLPLVGFSHQAPPHRSPPDFDQRLDRRPKVRALPEAKAVAADVLRSRVRGARVEHDELIDSPKHVLSTEGFLTGPDGEGRAVPPARVRALPAADPHRPVKAFLNEHAALYGHGAAPLDAARVRCDYVNRRNGLSTVAWEQWLDGIPVYEGVLVGHVTAAGELAAVSSQFVADPAAAANAGTPNRAALQQAPMVSAADAVALAAESLEEFLLPDEIVPFDPRPQGTEQRQRFRAGGLPDQAHVRLVWLPLDARLLRLCWEIELTRRDHGERFRLLVDAGHGEIHLRRRLTVYLADASYRVFTSDSPSPFTPSWPTPNTNQPPLAGRSLVTLAALNTNASPLGWIADGEQQTRGNNVDAHTDLNADNLADLPRPQSGPDRVFDFPLDLAQPPSAYRDAAVVQLFYWCNWTHDRLYELGFTEAAGNYQKDNLGRGGLGGDVIEADAQDGSGVNNANFTPTPDGVPGRIQMFVFTGPEPDRDGDLDAEIIIHEYVHGLSTRLVGGGVGIGTLQAAGLGEGWSDFYALALLSEPGDDPDGVYAYGGYATLNFFGLAENYYFGIRRYPYSTDLTKNPLTFKDIDPAQIDPHVGVPVSPIFGFNPVFANEVHSQGEVWCAMLWDARARLVHKHGHATGNELILQIVTDGMKLAPANPNFLQARDAILLADQINNAGANYADLWAAFARRGLGFSASSPPSTSTDGVVEAYDLPDSLLLTTLGGFGASGPAGGPFAPACLSYALTNISTQSFAWTVAVTAPWLSVQPAGGTLAPRGATSVTVCVNSTAAALGQGSYSGAILFSNARTRVVQERDAVLRVMSFTGLPFVDDFEAGRLLPHWNVSGTGDHVARVTSLNNPHAGSFHLQLEAAGTGLGARNELTLGLDLAGYTNVMLRFWAVDFGEEPDPPPSNPFLLGADFDGVAISEDGRTWYEIFPLRGLSPAYREYTVDLDAALAAHGLAYNAAFQIRFNQFDNFAIPFDGLGLDDISITGVPARRIVVTVPDSVVEGSGTLTNGGLVRVGTAVSMDTVVSLQSSDSSKAGLPRFVVIPAGADRAAFQISLPDNALLEGTQPVTIGASAAGFASGQARLSVVDDERAILTVTLPNTAREGDGLLRGKGRVRLQALPQGGGDEDDDDDGDDDGGGDEDDDDGNGGAARSVTVRLETSHPGKLVVPATVSIPAGRTETMFDLNVLDDAALDGTVTVTVTALVDNWQAGARTMPIRDNDVPGLRVELPAAAGEGNGVLPGAGAVHLVATARSNVVVSLASRDTTELTTAASVTIPAGQFTARFDLAVQDDALVDGVQTVSVTASARGFPTATGRMNVLDDETPPVPGAPTPKHLSTNQAVSLALSWNPGIGEILINGGFEAGSFLGWDRRESGFGAWVINDGQLDPDGPDQQLPPRAGRFNALAQQFGGGTHELFQDVSIPADAQSAAFSWWHRVRNHATHFSTPNQEFRVELRDTAHNLLERLFATQEGDPLLQGWTNRSVDLSAWRGRTVRLAFVEQDNLGYFNAHVDDASVRLGAPGVPTEFDVYFGTTPMPGPGQRLGTTTNNFFPLPALALNTTYYWRIVSRRGAAATPGPVWRFTTRGVGPVDHFRWGPIASPQQAGRRFAVNVTAQDDINNTVRDFQGPVGVTALAGSLARSALVVTEIDVGTVDYVEFANAGPEPLDVSGWQVSFYSARSWPAPVITFALPAGTVLAPGALFWINEGGVAPGALPNFQLGTNVAWSTVAVNNPIAVLVRDGAGEFVDFVCAVDADPARITQPAPIPPEEWMGSAVPGKASTANTYQRTGSADRQDASDWIEGPNNIGAPNPGLVLPFARPTVSVAPALLTNFVTGVWSGFLTVHEPATRVTLRAEDARGRVGLSQAFTVGATNDVSVTVIDSPDLVAVGSNITWRVFITNSGPARATGLVLSNWLPPEVAFLTAETFSGACSNAGRLVRCEMIPLNFEDVMRVTITAATTRFGRLTNTATVSRAGPDPFPANNTAVSVSTVAGPFLWTSNLVGVTEGDSNTTTIYFPVRLTAPSALPVMASFTTSNITAVAGSDYLPTNGTVTIEPGFTNVFVPVPVVNDRLNEGLELFAFLLFDVSNAVPAVTICRGRITDNDPAPAFSVGDVTVTEGAPRDTNFASFNVRLSAPSGRLVAVNVATADGTAMSPVDYLGGFGTVVLNPPETNFVLSLPVVGDRRFEMNEQFFLNLSGAVNATISDNQGIATIIDDDAGEVERLVVSDVASPQIAGTPFFVSVTALNGLGQTAQQFDSPLDLRGVADRQEILVAAGTNRWAQPMGAFFHDARVQAIYLPGELGGPGRLAALALNVIVAPGQTLSNWTIRMQHSPLTAYAPVRWEANGWTTVYRRDETVPGPGWRTFIFDTPFDYNGTDSLLIDFSFNNATYTTDGVCASTPTAQRRSVYFQTDSGFGNPLDWSGTNAPPPLATNRVPSLRLIMENPAALSPPGPFALVSGHWSGPLAVLDPGTNIFLRALSDGGFVAEGNVFAVLAAGDLDGDGLPDAWEELHFGGLHEPGAGPAADMDGDGFSNLDECLAGTDPRDAAVALRVLSARRTSEGMRIEFTTVAGRGYRVERADSLSPAGWTALGGDHVGTGRPMTVTDPEVASDSRFYRVRLRP